MLDKIKKIRNICDEIIAFNESYNQHVNLDDDPYIKILDERFIENRITLRQIENLRKYFEDSNK